MTESRCVRAGSCNLKVKAASMPALVPVLAALGFHDFYMIISFHGVCLWEDSQCIP